MDATVLYDRPARFPAREGVGDGEGFLARRASVRDGKRVRFEVEANRRSVGTEQSCRPRHVDAAHRDSAAMELEERGGTRDCGESRKESPRF